MHDGTSGAPLSESVLALVGRWYAASFEAAEHALHRWLEPAVVTFAAAVEAHRNGERGDRTSLTLAARSFGAARASGGFTASDTLLDAAALLDLVPDVVPGDREAVERAVTDGWCGVNPKVGEVFASRAGLALRMRSLYHWAGPGNVGRGGPRDHALALVDVTPGEGDELADAARVVTAAVVCVGEWVPGGRVALLAPGRIAVLVRRHPGLAPVVDRLRDDVALASVTSNASSSVWLEALPERPEQVSPMLEILTECAPGPHDDADRKVGFPPPAVLSAGALESGEMERMRSARRPLPVALTAAAVVLSAVAGVAGLVGIDGRAPVEVTASGAAGTPASPPDILFLRPPAAGAASGFAVGEGLGQPSVRSVVVASPSGASEPVEPVAPSPRPASDAAEEAAASHRQEPDSPATRRERPRAEAEPGEGDAPGRGRGWERAEEKAKQAKNAGDAVDVSVRGDGGSDERPKGKSGKSGKKGHRRDR